MVGSLGLGVLGIGLDSDWSITITEKVITSI